MRILILGGDGYLGWPTAMHFASKGHDVFVVDNYLRRRIASETKSEALLPTPNLEQRCEQFYALTGNRIQCSIMDICDYAALDSIVREFQPETIVHYAEQPSAPYSMMGYDEGRLTLHNNLGTTFNVLSAVKERCPNSHIIKLGTMGEYGTPNIDIEEGYLEIEHKGRRDKFLYPRSAGSLYHTTKVLDTDLISFFVRIHQLSVTDLMQGPVYGLSTREADIDESLVPNFHYDDIFGTVLNRFLVQASIGIPLTIYGAGGQTRGYLNLKDTLQCVELAAMKPARNGELRIFNQMTEVFTVNELAEKVKEAGDALGLNVTVQNLANPRKEMEEHYYNPTFTGLKDLGLQPNYLEQDVLFSMLERIIPYTKLVESEKLMPRVKWS